MFTLAVGDASEANDSLAFGRDEDTRSPEKPDTTNFGDFGSPDHFVRAIFVRLAAAATRQQRLGDDLVSAIHAWHMVIYNRTSGV